MQKIIALFWKLGVFTYSKWRKSPSFGKGFGLQGKGTIALFGKVFSLLTMGTIAFFGKVIALLREYLLYTVSSENKRSCRK